MDDSAKYTIEVYKYRDRWYADMYDQEGNLMASGVGKTGPLDAVSNAAIVASNREFQHLQVSGT